MEGKNLMAYRNFYINGGYILVGRSPYQIGHDKIELSSQRLTYFQDEDGRTIPYDYPMFQHDLRCELPSGYLHVYVLCNEHQIISFHTGIDAEGDGDYWNLSALQYSYGRSPYPNYSY